MGRVGARILIVAWVVTAGVATHARIGVWTAGEAAIWASAVAEAPAKPRPWINLGRQYALDGDRPAAESAYRRGMAAADAPGRTPDERIFGYGLGAANVAILTCAQAFDEAFALVGRALTRRPAPTALLEVQQWLQAQDSSGQRCSPVSSF